MPTADADHEEDDPEGDRERRRRRRRRPRSRGARRPSAPGRWPTPRRWPLERDVGERVALLRLEGERAPAPGQRPVGPLPVLAVVPAADALHEAALRAPAAAVDEDPQPRLQHGQRPQPLADAAAAGLARLVLPAPQPLDVLGAEQPAPGQRRRDRAAPRSPRRSGPSTQSVMGTLMPNFRRQTTSRGRCLCRISFRTYFSHAPCSFICGRQAERGLGQRAVEERHAHVEGPGVRHALRRGAGCSASP